jgi:L-cystine uptake protein TcyP (sodium:dicarboxylate symporter family)
VIACTPSLAAQLEHQEVAIARHFLGPVRRSKSACWHGDSRVAIQLKTGLVIRLKLHTTAAPHHEVIRFEDFTGWFRVRLAGHVRTIKVVTR